MNLKNDWPIIILSVLLFFLLTVALTACASNSANVVSYNLSQEADQFRITRRIVFYNGITNEYILVIEGLCSLGNNDAPGELTVTCKVGPESYKKHFLGLSDNVTYFAEQIDAYGSNPWQYKVIMRPTTILPDLELDLP